MGMCDGAAGVPAAEYGGGGMNFNSGVFLIFLPIVVAVYWLLPHKVRKYWLLAASYFFYMYANPALVVLLLASTILDYCCSWGMEKYRGNRPVMKLLLLVSILGNLGMLFTFKYFDFFADTVNSLCTVLGLSYQIPQLGLILPVGISFYTFQTMSYSIDVYRGDFHAEKNFPTFALYVTYFPQLVAGPIENPRNLMPQLRKEHHWNWEDFSAGARLLLSGFFRKCVVADFCGIFVNHIFGNLENANSLAIVCAGALFAIQIYCDFAGYSEIAAGCARMMGVRLMRNFDRPYLSQSATELFRRWHISLNQWFTQYVYIPLGGGRKGKVRKLLNLTIVFTLCGLWHGARWTYVLWGLYAALCLVVENLLNIPNRFGPEWDTPLGRLLRRSGTFMLYIVSALIFRSESLGQLGVVCYRVVTQIGFSTAYFQQAFTDLGLTSLSLAQLVLCIVAMAKLSTWGQYDLPAAKTAYGYARRLCAGVYGVVLIALCWLALLATQDSAIFAYFQF